MVSMAMYLPRFLVFWNFMFVDINTALEDLPKLLDKNKWEYNYNNQFPAAVVAACTCTSKNNVVCDPLILQRRVSNRPKHCGM